MTLLSPLSGDAVPGAEAVILVAPPLPT